MAEALDWLVAMDDALTERWHHCTLCGRRAAQPWGEIVVVGALALMTIRCSRCYAQDPRLEAVHARLVQRYQP
jgi:hypothetical protein